MKPYPKYKDSGIPWLGEIPAHWEVRRLKYVAEVNPSNIDKKCKEEEDEILLCNYVDVYKNEYISSDIIFMKATAAKKQIEKFILEKGDVIATKDSETPDDIANPALVKEDFHNVVCGYHLTHIKPKSIYGPYVFRLFQAKYLQVYFENSANGITRFGIGVDKFHWAPILLPSSQEQQQIAEYLDRKTGQIDTLIEKKKRLIALLKEERSAVINQAVTKGIDPNAPMKDSGIPWLGEIPAHWELIQLKYLTAENGIVRGPFGSSLKIEYFVDKGFKVYEQKNAIYKDITLGHYFVDEKKYNELKRFSIKEGDMIISCSGTIGKIFQIPKNYIPGLINQALLKLTLSKKIFPKYFVLLFESYIYQILIIDKTQGGAMQNLVGIDRFKSMKYLCPPIKEQHQIADYLDQETRRIDTLIAKTEKGIDLLQEYRTALISEVVTGKIDVRKEVF